ncbi:MAG: DUF1292 domain-containing protein [Clostridiales bacterium]|nr:DUF1292 domain-containing protein [Clostridiales bacterium]
MLFDTDDNYVVLELEDEAGNRVRYEMLDLVEYNGEAFGIFLPAEDHGGEVAILRLAGEDAQKAEGYVPVNDEELEQAVFDIFQIKNMDAFDFGGNTFAQNDLFE